ncbi:MAG: hypothetical protein ACKO5K_13210 [Armatimonadota bacterium]
MAMSTPGQRPAAAPDRGFQIITAPGRRGVADDGTMAGMHLPLAATARFLALVASVLLGIMMVLTAVTGVAQEPFEVVRTVEEYRAMMLRGAPALGTILSVDTLFIAAYAAFFIAYARVVEAAGTRELLRPGLLALLATALLDILEDQHLLALSRSVALGEDIGLATLRGQQLLSQTKFHIGYVGLFLFGIGLPRRDWPERVFAFAVALPIPVLGAVLWSAPPAWVPALSIARWFGFLFGFLGAVVLLGRAVSPPAPPSRSGDGVR